MTGVYEGPSDKEKVSSLLFYNMVDNSLVDKMEVGEKPIT